MAQPSSAQEPKGGDKFLFLVVFAWVFVLTLTVLNLVGFVPYYIDGTPSREVAEAAAERDRTAVQEEIDPVTEAPIILPTRLEIPVAGTNVPISNPNTTDVVELDNELLTAVVRYPGSGTLGADGNIFIFGHSTGYRTVNNQMFKAFNALKTLEEGNVIKLVSGDTEYIYTVTLVEHKDASEVTVDFTVEPGVQKLTLSTCDSFGAKTERYIVTAEFAGSYLSSELGTKTIDSQ